MKRDVTGNYYYEHRSMFVMSSVIFANANLLNNIRL